MNKLPALLMPLIFPILLGFFTKTIKLFNDKENATLRKFVIRITVPFIVFNNLYKASIDELKAILPLTIAFLLLSILYALTAKGISLFIKDNINRKTFIFSTFTGNYGYLGWGVILGLYGEKAFTGSVIFNLFFWPVFLTIGIFLEREKNVSQKGVLRENIINHAGIPLLSAILGIIFNLNQTVLPQTSINFINTMANITVPMILFTIGCSISLNIKKEKLKVILLSSFTRLILGIFLGIITALTINLIFGLSTINQKVILMESVMPSAVMSIFYANKKDIDASLISSIIAVSTLISLGTIPLWYVLIEKIINFL